MIADRASRVIVKAIALRSGSTGGHAVGRVSNACFNDCANIQFLVVHRQQFFLIAGSASSATVKAIASHSKCAGARTVGPVLVLMIAPTFLGQQVVDC